MIHSRLRTGSSSTPVSCPMSFSLMHRLMMNQTIFYLGLRSTVMSFAADETQGRRPLSCVSRESAMLKNYRTSDLDAEEQSLYFHPHCNVSIEWFLDPVRGPGLKNEK
ncbi:hypothetical protein MSAN_02454500 [Mycena sanguinolenta]|uniref:Uncharacterized protein n=1 Tax=Mycena sanguinolenta TaxID=230812 RepID=A0A8H6WXR0_9AGAR|nr:hypothetical protein MSAN_02454500 [Mycena sanguinolenta]